MAAQRTATSMNGSTSVSTSRWQRMSSGARLAIVAVPGVLAGVATSFAAGWELVPVVGWVVAALIFLVWTWRAIWPMDAEDTRALATHQDPSRGVTDSVLIVAALASLGAVAVLVGGNVKSVPSWVSAVLVVLSLAGSWGVTHTIFTLRYASAYYGAEPHDGISFNTDSPPCYVDFAYVALTVGMTYQVSDTDLKHTHMRALAIKHMLVSYVFGAVILASAIQVVAGLAK